MNEQMTPPFQRLEAGRIWVDYGPTQMLVLASGPTGPNDEMAHAGASAAIGALDAVAALRSVVRRPWTELAALEETLPAVPRAMIKAARLTGDETLTPMAAVAGSIADATVAAMAGAGASRAMANNGGDIALWLAKGEEATVGLLPGGDGQPTYSLRVPAGLGIGGVCTSGMGGRSMTRGIATAVTVLASSAALADAAATLVANATCVAHPSIEQVPAHTLDPLTDIPNLLVTVRIGDLPAEVVEQALAQAQAAVRSLADRGLIQGAVIAVGGRVVAILPPEVVLQGVVSGG